MAKTSVTKRAQQYHLPEETRLALISGSSDKPDATIPPHRLAIVYRKRRRFIRVHGHDGLGSRVI